MANPAPEARRGLARLQRRRSILVRLAADIEASEAGVRLRAGDHYVEPASVATVRRDLAFAESEIERLYASSSCPECGSERMSPLSFGAEVPWQGCFECGSVVVCDAGAEPRG